MNLFSHSSDLGSTRKSYQPVLSEWADKLPDAAIEHLERVLPLVLQEYSQYKCYPGYEDIFRAYRETLPEKVKVVVIGQDPYYNGNANGLAFGCKLDISPSLKMIMGAILSDYPDKEPRYPSSGPGLEYWPEQGVLLINSILTVREGQAQSHSEIGWRTFTEYVVEWLSSTYPDIVWMLWGATAKAFAELINPSNGHLILQAAHPVSAAYANTTWECPHFLIANRFLTAKGKKPIIWF